MKVEDKLQPRQEEEYYAVEYQKAFYIKFLLRPKEQECYSDNKVPALSQGKSV